MKKKETVKDKSDSKSRRAGRSGHGEGRGTSDQFPDPRVVTRDPLRPYSRALGGLFSLSFFLSFFFFFFDPLRLFGCMVIFTAVIDLQ